MNTSPILESTAKTLIINERNQALILTIGEYKAHPEKSFTPDLPGGLVEQGEAARDGALREAREETGIELDPLTIHVAYTETKFFPDENKSVSKFFYIAKLPATPEVTLSWEHASFAWMPLESLLKDVKFRPFYEEAITYCFEHKII